MVSEGSDVGDVRGSASSTARESHLIFHAVVNFLQLRVLPRRPGTLGVGRFPAEPNFFAFEFSATLNFSFARHVELPGTET